MSKGVYTFQGGTDRLIGQIREELLKNGVDIRIRCLVEKIEVDDSRRACGVIVNRRGSARAVLSNANLKTTVLKLVGSEHFDPEFVAETRAVRLNNSSCQVYIALKPGEGFDYSAISCSILSIEDSISKPC